MATRKGGMTSFPASVQAAFEPCSRLPVCYHPAATIKRPLGRNVMKKVLSAAVLAVVGLVLAGGAAAEYPDRPIKMIVPWAAGGDTDNIFRPLAPLLQKHLGQPVVIANVSGASGTVGAREAKGSPPDGYTVYAVHDYIHLVHYAGVTDVKYSDFEPICLLSATPSVLTASPKTPWKSWAELADD